MKNIIILMLLFGTVFAHAATQPTQGPKDMLICISATQAAAEMELRATPKGHHATGQHVKMADSVSDTVRELFPNMNASDRFNCLEAGLALATEGK